MSILPKKKGLAGNDLHQLEKDGEFTLMTFLHVSMEKAFEKVVSKVDFFIIVVYINRFFGKTTASPTSTWSYSTSHGQWNQSIWQSSTILKIKIMKNRSYL